VLLTAREARAQGVPYRVLKGGEAEVIESLGETLVPGARAAGIAHFIDHQVSVPPEEALLEARILNVRPPYLNFYRAAAGAADGAAKALHGRGFAQLSDAEQRELVNLMRRTRGRAGGAARGIFVTQSCAAMRWTSSTAPRKATRRWASLHGAHIAPPAG
jgi:hypothetical protein